jgi:hypothetical protein
VRAQVSPQAIAILAPARGAAEARDAQSHLAHAHLREQRRQQHDRLGVDGRILRAERLRADLPELPVATGLGALVAEEARAVPQLDRLTALVHAVLDVGPADRRRSLRPQRQRAARGVGEREHLLAHDVRRLAHAAGEQLRRLERRRLDPLVAGALEDAPRACLQCRACLCLLAKHVERAPRRFDLGDAQLTDAVASGTTTAWLAERSSARNGFVSRSRPSVVMPMWPG